MHISQQDYDTVRNVVLREWDPIGVSQFAGAQNEYDSYVPGICTMLIAGRTARELADHLWQIETVSMGLSGDRPHTEAIARRLCAIRDRFDGAM